MTPQDQQSPIQSVGADTVREQDKIQLVLAYLGLLCLIPFLTVKDSEYVKWHAKQGLVMMIAWIPFSIALMVVGMIPVIGWILSCVAPIGGLVLMIMAIMKALKGERWRIPLLADLADKF
jgi:fumarate reductase subunit D